MGLFGTHDPVAVIKNAVIVADVLKDVADRKGLISNIKGKEYPRVEAWQMIATMVGATPFLEWSRPIDQGYEARVVVRDRDGRDICAGEGQCTRHENTWKGRDDYAIRGMAQTRACSRALRSALGFVMTLAGYEATPAEEMEERRAKGAKKETKQAEPPKASPQREALLADLAIAAKQGDKVFVQVWKSLEPKQRQSITQDELQKLQEISWAADEEKAARKDPEPATVPFD